LQLAPQGVVSLTNTGVRLTQPPLDSLNVMSCEALGKIMYVDYSQLAMEYQCEFGDFSFQGRHLFTLCDVT